MTTVYAMHDLHCWTDYIYKKTEQKTIDKLSNRIRTINADIIIKKKVESPQSVHVFDLLWDKVVVDELLLRTFFAVLLYYLTVLRKKKQ